MFNNCFWIGNCVIENTTITSNPEQRGKAAIEFESQTHQLACNNVTCSFFEIGIICRGTTLLRDSYIHHCTHIGVWVDNTEKYIYCELNHCALVRCLEGIRCCHTNLSVVDSVIVYVDVGIHCNQGMAVLIRGNVIHECRKMSVLAKRIRLLQLLANALYDCSAGCDFHCISSCQITNNCLLYIKNRMFLLTSCFVKLVFWYNIESTIMSIQLFVFVNSFIYSS